MPDGVPSCERTDQTSTLTACDAVVKCSDTAQVAGVPIGLSGSLRAHCFQQMDTQWSCTCDTSAGTANLDVDAMDSWDACTQASALCPDLVEVPIDASAQCYGAEYYGPGYCYGDPY